MKKIYVDGNYTIVEVDGKIFPFPISSSEYNESLDHFIIRKFPNKAVYIITFDDISNWQNDVGVVFTIETMRTFLRNNTNYIYKGELFLLGSVNVFSDLPDPTTNTGGRYEVLEGSEGYQVLGKRYFGKDPGVYVSDGFVWKKLSQEDVDTHDINSDSTNLLWTTDTVLNNQLDDLSSYLQENVIKNTFETVSKNLKQYPYSLNYTGDLLTSIVYQNGLEQITKTLTYTNGLLNSITLSGDLPSNINLTKTLTYSNGKLTNIIYS